MGSAMQLAKLGIGPGVPPENADGVAQNNYGTIGAIVS